MATEKEKSLELIYDEVFHQYQGAFRSFQTMRERTGQIIGFIGIILNLEILALIQIKFYEIFTHDDYFLIGSIVLLVGSLIVATWAYRHIPFETLSTKTCLKKEYLNKNKTELLELIITDRIKDIDQNKELIYERASCIHLSMCLFTLSIILVSIFFLINFSGFNITLIIVGVIIIITFLLYAVIRKDFLKKLKIN